MFPFQWEPQSSFHIKQHLQEIIFPDSKIKTVQVSKFKGSYEIRVKKAIWVDSLDTSWPKTKDGWGNAITQFDYLAAFWIKNIEIKYWDWGLPWWRSGWESACQCRGLGFEPWSGKIPHAAERLGLWATTTEPARLEPELRNKRGRDGERPGHRDEEWPPLAATRESPSTETKTQLSHK